MKPRAAVLFTTVALVGLAGCKADARRKASHDAMIQAAMPCPPPAICVRKTKASLRDVTVCAPNLDGQAYAVGDIIVTKEMKEHEELARIVAHRGAAYDVVFGGSDQTFERSPARILGRVCH